MVFDALKMKIESLSLIFDSKLNYNLLWEGRTILIGLCFAFF